MTPTQPDQGAEPPPRTEYTNVNVRLGLWLFGVYLAWYAGFMALSAFAPHLMSARPLGGLNTAILYGLGLIALAFFLAMVYVGLCRRGDQKVGPQ
ncbi:MAG: DUF485 domain-containing protein [Isosphaeraceae bacterium]